jgi:hypothetical protein
MRTVIVGILATLCAGCVAVWGRPHNVIAASERSVTIEFDHSLATASDIRQIAEAECNKFRRSALLRDPRPSMLMGITIHDYDCVENPSLAWGRPFNIALANSRSVVIEYMPFNVSLPEVLRNAQAECSRFGRDAVLDRSSRGELGIAVNTYRCVER